MAEGVSSDAQESHGAPRECLALASGDSFEGLLVALGGARIEGCLRGRVWASGELEIGAKAMVEGDLDVGCLLVAGRIRGVIRASSRVELGATALVEGEIHAPGVVIAEGCRVDARCRIDGGGRPSRRQGAEKPAR